MWLDQMKSKHISTNVWNCDRVLKQQLFVLLLISITVHSGFCPLCYNTSQIFQAILNYQNFHQEFRFEQHTLVVLKK